MNETMEPELCPICGKPVEVGDFSGEHWFIFSECGNEFAPNYVKTREELIAAWNRRPSGWISVNKRMPEKTGEYLTYQERNGEYHTIEYWAPEDLPRGIYFPGWDFDHERVTHWQPLPEPPEVEE
jgi:hypothetical protein